MNTSIWSNFTGFQSQNTLNQNFSDTVIKSSEQQKATYERVAGYCKSWYAPVFASDKVSTDSDNSTSVGVGVGVEVVPVDLKENVSEPSTQALTIPPMKIEQNDLLNAALVGLGVVFVLKILE
jgi:hypothetical protein